MNLKTNFALFKLLNKFAHVASLYDSAALNFVNGLAFHQKTCLFSLSLTIKSDLLNTKVVCCINLLSNEVIFFHACDESE